MTDKEERIREIVRRIAEAEQLGGGFRDYFETAVRELLKLCERETNADSRPLVTYALSCNFRCQLLADNRARVTYQEGDGDCGHTFEGTLFECRTFMHGWSLARARFEGPKVKRDEVLS